LPERSAMKGKHIERIIVRKLFGHLNYEVFKEASDVTHDDLLILYGDNGSGKTTILRMLFSLLTAQPNRGYKTFLAHTQFSAFEVHFADHSMAAVKKERGKLLGGYTLTIREADGTQNQFHLKVDDEGVIRRDESIPGVMQALTSLGVSLYFLPDDRRVQVDFAEDIFADPTTGLHYRHRDARYVLRRSSPDDDHEWPETKSAYPQNQESHHLHIAPVLNALTTWLRQQTLRGANTSDESASTIYLGVIQQLGSVKWPSSGDKEITTYDFLGKIEALDKRIQKYLPFGLAANFPARDFILHFSSAAPRDQRTIEVVLRPYLDSLDARLSALQETYDIVSTYVRTLNSFFSRKRVHIDVANGITVTTEWGDRIASDVLSSGEKQLLLLLSNTILARNRSSIFIIDEPELSLNVKWQRQLVEALLSCSQNGGIQYILASHSIEMITQFRTRTVQLLSENAI
jgi:ABC-type cobalamin/Fe3+-siderophores transport system ATPase subunit